MLPSRPLIWQVFERPDEKKEENGRKSLKSHLLSDANTIIFVFCFFVDVLSFLFIFLYIISAFQEFSC